MGLESGDRDYRAYVGPPQFYDLVAGLAAGLLFAVGLRETHKLLDLGCGSLRVGRVLIPYLRPDNYFGVEPNRWLIEEGIEKELGRDLVALKRPSFRHVSDFSADAFGVPFDYALAQSIFSHTYPDMAASGLKGIAKALSPQGLLFATYFPGEETPAGSGWLYPGVVPYRWPRVREMASEAGLVAEPLSWPHPLQKWFVAGLPSAAESVRDLSCRVRPPLDDPVRDEPGRGA
jgi:hypothetical protein